MRKLTVALVGTLFLIATACADDGTTDVSTSGPASSKTLATPTPLPRLPLSEARLAGRYNVKLYVTGNTFDSKPLQGQTFRFVPRCDEGACDVSVVGAIGFGQGLEDRQSAGAEKRFDIRLANLDRSYRGTKIGYWASCGDEPDKDRWTFAIKVDKARYLNGTWMVIRWSGTWTRSANFGSTCLPGHLRSVIRGTLDQP